MAVLVDTNVLLRRTQPAHAQHRMAVESVARLLKSGETVHVTAQNMAQFWNVATRPAANNGLGFSVAATASEIAKLEQALILLPDTHAIYEAWKQLVVRHRVVGAKVHDTRLVAAMLVHRVPRMLTFNTGDFSRYDVEVLHPAALAG